MDDEMKILLGLGVAFLAFRLLPKGCQNFVLQPFKMMNGDDTHRLNQAMGYGNTIDTNSAGGF